MNKKKPKLKIDIIIINLVLLICGIFLIVLHILYDSPSNLGRGLAFIVMHIIFIIMGIKKGFFHD